LPTIVFSVARNIAQWGGGRHNQVLVRGVGEIFKKLNLFIRSDVVPRINHKRRHSRPVSGAQEVTFLPFRISGRELDQPVKIGRWSA
jgi:hypothetical protein